MLTSALSWLVGSKAGRITALVILSSLIIATVLLRAFQAGQKTEQLKQAEASLKALRDRVATDETVRAMPRDKRKEELLRWARQ
jgi:hypothetical protein